MSGASAHEELLGKTLDEIIGENSNAKQPAQGGDGEPALVASSVYASFNRKSAAGKSRDAGQPAAAEYFDIAQDAEGSIDLPLEVYGKQKRRSRSAAGKRSQPFPTGRKLANSSARSSNMLQGLNGATLVGRVKSFSTATSWGFVRSERISSRDIFLHANDCDTDMGLPRLGDEVEFELEHTEDGDPRAANVRLAWPASRQAPAPKRGGGQLALGDAPRTGRSRSAAARGGQSQPSSARVRVGNFTWTLTRFELREAFEACGEVLRIEMDEARVGQAVVEFHTAAAARRAVSEYDQGLLNGRQIFVRAI